MIETPKVKDSSLVYMYGLSDFWTDIFGDTDLVEAILASTTVNLGEVYSYFLQRAAGVSLDDVGNRLGTRIKLLVLRDSDAIDNLGKEFKIDSNISSANYISNRPILPTQVLVNDVHYEIHNGVLKFNKPLSELKFPVRYLNDGDTAYALWINDVEMNEHWVENSFGRLVGFTEDDAIFNYKSFLEGVYYLYANGPNIGHIERGINLAMGMPYARESEEVLSIQQDSVSGNWSVFTATTEYELPYGYRPDLSAGDRLVKNEVLTTWVSIKDYVKDGEWWYDIFLPKEIVGVNGSIEGIGRCSKGSTGDKILQNGLKYHMFEVLITQPSGDERSFDTAKRLVMYSKPSYTLPVFVWKVPITDEDITITDDDFTMRVRVDLEDSCICPPSIRFMDRGTIDDGFIRGKSWYDRCQGSVYAASLIGYGDWVDNAGWDPYFDHIQDNYGEYMEALMNTRGDIIHTVDRSCTTRGWRGRDDKSMVEALTWSIPGDKVFPNTNSPLKIYEKNITPLYMMTEPELISKVSSIFPRFTVSEDDFVFALTGLNLVDVYDVLMRRNDKGIPDLESSNDKFNFEYTYGGLDIALSHFSNQAFVPDKSMLHNEDGSPITTDVLFISRNIRKVWTIQWAHMGSTPLTLPTMMPVEDQDLLRLTERYDMNDTGKSSKYKDSIISFTDAEVTTNKTLKSEVSPILILGGAFIEDSRYNIDVRTNSIVIPIPLRHDGFLSTVPRAAASETISADSDRYVVSGNFDDPEELLIFHVTSPFTYEVRLDIKVTPAIGNTTEISFVNDLPRIGELAVLKVDHADVHIDEILQAGQYIYSIESGYTVKIFSDGQLIPDSEYSIEGTVLSFSSLSKSDMTLRYYRNLDSIMYSLFDRGTVARNNARFLMDRDRENGEYTHDDETVYMNRSGKAWLEVPEDGDTPKYADKVDVVRRLI